MNILLTALQPVGGIRTYFRYVYGSHSFNDCSFTLIAPDEGLIDFLDEFIPDGRIKVIRTQGKLDFIAKIRGQLRNETFAIIHSHGFSAGILTELAMFGLSGKHLMTAHDVFTEFQFKGIEGIIKKKIISKVFNKIDFIHTVTKDADQNLQDFFPSIHLSKLRYIPHGIDSERFQSAHPRDFKAELNFPEGQQIIGFFGRFMGQKGFRVLVKAMKIIVNDQKVESPKVLTFGWGGYIREDYQYIADEGLSEYFIQMPNTDDMPAAIKGVDVVAMPSRWEACGLLGMEALCSGTPIVGTNCIGLREVLENSPAIAIDVDDVSALAQALNKSLEQEQKHNIQNYVPEAVKRFDVSSAAEGMRKLYVEVSCK